MNKQDQPKTQGKIEDSIKEFESNFIRSDKKQEYRAYPFNLEPDTYDAVIEKLEEALIYQQTDLIERVSISDEELMVFEHMQRAWFEKVTKETHPDWLKLSDSLKIKVKKLHDLRAKLDELKKSL